MSDYTARTTARLDALREADSAAYVQLTMCVPFALSEEDMNAQLTAYEEENGYTLGDDPAERDLDDDEEEEPEDDEEEDLDEPDADAITTTDHRKFWQYHKLAFEIGEDENCEDAIVAYMDAQQFYPDAWWISDHGNAHRIDLTEATKRAEAAKLQCRHKGCGLPAHHDGACQSDEVEE